MFSDPISFTVNSVATSLAKVSNQGFTSTYRNGDGTLVAVISHQEQKSGRVRSLVKLTQKKTVADPLTAVNDTDFLVCQFTIDRPAFGWSATELNYVVQALAGFLTSGNVTKIYGEES